MRYHKHSDAGLGRSYQLMSEVGLAIGLLLFITAFLVSKDFSSKQHYRPAVIEPFEVEQITATVQHKARPRPLRPPLEVAGPEDPLPADADIEYPSSQVWTIPDVPPFAGKEVVELVDFIAVEVKPELIGGIAALYSRVVYPVAAQRAGIEGDVLVAFTVGVDGSVRDLQLVQERPEELGFAQAAMDALSQVRFSPGKQRDRPVAVRMQQALRFRLEH